MDIFKPVLRTSVSLIVSYYARQALTPPHEPLATESQQDQLGLVSLALRTTPLLSYLFYVFDVGGLLIGLLQQRGGSGERLFCPRVDLLQWGTAEWIGLVGLFLSAQVRLWCYRVLGRFFTFKLSIRKDHQLITTGPYAYVRHPSYTAGLAMVSSLSLRSSGPHSIVACWIPSAVMWTVYPMCGLGAAWVFGTRIIQEEQMLAREFKGQWDKYKAAVPYRLIPGVW